MDSHEKNRLYGEGLEAFNSRKFFEAHELWEDVWRQTPDPDRKFLQGLIQVAAAFHHCSRSNVRGTRNLLREGLLKLDAFPEAYGGLDIEPLRAAVREWLTKIGEAGEIPKNLNPPRIKRHAGSRLST
jgi:uncharacterized protein